MAHAVGHEASTTRPGSTGRIPSTVPSSAQYPSIAFDSKSGNAIVFGGYSSRRQRLQAGHLRVVGQRHDPDQPHDGRHQAAAALPGRHGLRQQARPHAAVRRHAAPRHLRRPLGLGARPARVVADHLHRARDRRRATAIWMFYDPVRDKVYVYGLNQGNYQIWEYDPALNKWLDRTVTSPPAGVSRSYFDVGFDSTRGKIMEIGGITAGTYNTDIWEWDTTTGTWAQAMPATGSTVPDGRYYHTLAYDPIRRVRADGGRPRAHHGQERRRSTIRGSGTRTSATWSETTPAGGEAAAARAAPDGVQLAARIDVPVRRHRPRATRPTAPPSSGSTCRTPRARDNGAGCTASTAYKCKSRNCVDGVCCAQTAAECTGKCKSCNVAGKRGHVQQRPGRAAGQDTCPSDLACDATQQCKALLGHACTSFRTARAATAPTASAATPTATAPASSATWPRSSAPARRFRTASRIRRPAPPIRSSRAPATAPASAPRASEPAASRATPAFSARAATASTASAATPTARTTCYTCAKPMAEGTCSVLAAGEADHSATTPCDGPMQYCSGSGTCATNKKPNGGLCPGGASDCGSGFCIDGVCCATAPASAPASRATSGAARAPACSPRSVSRTRTRPRRARVPACTATAPASARRARRRTAPPAPWRPTADSNFCVDGVCCESACTATCYTCAASGNGKCTGVLSGAHRPERRHEVRGPELLHQPARVHVGQEAERRDLHDGQRLRVELLRGRHLLRKLVLRPEQPLQELQERDGQLYVRRRRHRHSQRLQG